MKVWDSIKYCLLRGLVAVTKGVVWAFVKTHHTILWIGIVGRLMKFHGRFFLWNLQHPEVGVEIRFV